MNNTILFLILLCIFLVVSLGINYSNIFAQTVTNMQTYTYTPTPITPTKYNTPESYELDATASQGVFSSILNLNNHILEPMVSGKNEKTMPNSNMSRNNKTVGSTYPEEKMNENKDMLRIQPNINAEKINEIKDMIRDNHSNIASTYSADKLNNYMNKKNVSGEDMWRSTPTSRPQDAFEGINSNTKWANLKLHGNNKANDNYEASHSPLYSEQALGCSGTQYGCCPDNVTTKNSDGSNCDPEPSSCENSLYGCCPDGITAKNSDGTSCVSYTPEPMPDCASSQYGCCLDEKTAKNADGSNCSTMNMTYNNPKISGIVASGPNNFGYRIKGPMGNVFKGTSFNCSNSPYGCCSDGVSFKNLNGTNCPNTMSNVMPATMPNVIPTTLPNTLPYVNVYGPNAGCASQGQTMSANLQPVGACANTQYGCCPDNVTAKNAYGSNCMSGMNVYSMYGPNNTGYAVQGPQGNIFYGSTANLQQPVGGCAGTQYGCCPDNVTAKNADGSNCMNGMQNGTQTTEIGGCAGTQYGCCPDNVTAKNSVGSNCSPYPPPPVQTNTVFIPPPRRRMRVDNNSYETNAATVDSSINSTSNDSSINSYSNDSSNDTSVNSYNSSSNSSASCPEPSPCPPCGRCPEPSFDCKKVPNYASTNSEYLPMPVLSDFSQFGM